MTRTGVSIGVAVVAGVLAVVFLPPLWLAPLSAVTTISCGISAIIVRVNTKTEPSSNPVAGILLSVVNLPELPLAKVKKDWALSMFLASAAFLVTLGLSVMVLANA